MTDADGELSETIVWLDFAESFGYISREECASFTLRYEEAGKILGNLIDNPEKFIPRPRSGQWF